MKRRALLRLCDLDGIVSFIVRSAPLGTLNIVVLLFDIRCALLGAWGDVQLPKDVGEARRTATVSCRERLPTHAWCFHVKIFCWANDVTLLFASSH